MTEINRPPARNGLSAEDAPEEFARRAMIRCLAEVCWIFGVDPNSIFVSKMRRALDLPQLAAPPPAATPAGDKPEHFFCEGCGMPDMRWSRSQKYCFDSAETVSWNARTG